MWDSSFTFTDRFQFGLGGDGRSERKYAAENAQVKLKELEEVDGRLEQSRRDFVQLAIATRLRSEFAYDQCSSWTSDRSRPISIRLRSSRRLSRGCLLTIELTNRLSGATLIDWTVFVRLWPLNAIDIDRDGIGDFDRSMTESIDFDRSMAIMDVDSSDRQQGSIENSSSRTHVYELSRLDPGGKVEFEIYSEESISDDRPFLVQVYLTRYFQNRIDAKSSRMLSFHVGTTMMSDCDSVQDRWTATFATKSNSSMESGHDETEGGEFRFCVLRSLMELLFPHSSPPHSAREFFGFLFPQVQKWDWPTDEMDRTPPANVHTQTLTMGTKAKVECTIEEREKTDDYLVTIRVSSYGSKSGIELAGNLKAAVWLKMMISIRQLRKYQSKITMDFGGLSISDESVESELDEYVTSRFPFA